jgi:hypothetical protein
LIKEREIYKTTSTWQISTCFVSSWFLFCRSSTIAAFARAISTVLSASSKAASLDLVRRSRALLSSCSLAIYIIQKKMENSIMRSFFLVTFSFKWSSKCIHFVSSFTHVKYYDILKLFYLRSTARKGEFLDIDLSSSLANPLWFEV